MRDLGNRDGAGNIVVISGGAYRAEIFLARKSITLEMQ